MKTFSDLEKNIGYTFKNQSLLVNALTHTSYANEQFRTNQHLKSNERVEFVGDAVVGLVVGSYIFNTYPEMPEGRLSKLRASVVCEATLAKLALSVGIDEFIRLGIGEEQTGGRRKASLLADAFESVMGAVFLDGGFDVAQKTVLALVVPEIEARVDNFTLSDYKSRLQELLGKTKKVARYEIVSSSGPDHDKTFTARVEVEQALFACGEGKTKKDAEQMAAKSLLEQIKA